jgi:hypothetical protein
LGRTAPSKGLTTMIRAVAVARSNGIDTRLRIVGPSTNAIELRYRRELETLVRDIALTSVVSLHDAVDPSQVGTQLASAHALIDASADDDLRRAPLEAIAAGRPVLTSNRRLARLLPGDELALDFAPGDPTQLAQRIGLVAELWPASLGQLADAARHQLAPAHAREVLADQWATALDAVHERVTARRTAAAAAEPAPSMNGDSGRDPLDDELFPPATEEIPLEPAGAVARFLDAWAQLDPERALASCAPGAFRYATTTDGMGDGVPVPDYLFWAAQTADSLDSTLEEIDVIDDRTVVAVRRDRWTIGDDHLVVVVRSLFELEDDLVTAWTETELRGQAPEPVVAAMPAAVTATLAPDDAPAPTTAPAAPAEPVVVEPMPGLAPTPDVEARPVADVPAPPPPPPPATPAPSPAPAPAPAPSASPAPAAAAPLASDATPATGSVAEQLERAEEQIHHWRRQALIWRERALEARALGEAYKSNVEDLRVIVEVLKRQSVISLDPDAKPDALDAGSSAGDERGDAGPIRWSHDDRSESTPPAPQPAPAPEPAPAPPAAETTGTSVVPARRNSMDAFIEKSARLARQWSRSFGKR